MRYNLDPFSEFSEDQIWQALEDVSVFIVYLLLVCGMCAGSKIHDSFFLFGDYGH